MRDIFGIAVAVMIALLSQIVEPWSGPWWTTLIISAVIAIVAASDIVAKQISRGSADVANYRNGRVYHWLYWLCNLAFLAKCG